MFLRQPLLIIYLAVRFYVCEGLSTGFAHFDTDFKVFEAGIPDLFSAKKTGLIKGSYLHFHQRYDDVCPAYIYDPKMKYRTVDGSCNNFRNLGQINKPLKRLLPAEYDDGINAPRYRGKDGSPLPSPTEISRLLHREGGVKHNNRTIMFMQWGQFIDHDVALSPVATNEDTLQCCDDNDTYPQPYRHTGVDDHCFPIKIGPNDTRFLTNCMEFIRSLPSRTYLGQLAIPREQMNAITSFVDGSVIYGSSEQELDHLRDPRNRALLKLQKALLPRSEEDTCIFHQGHYCFLAGDERVNEQPGLAALHTVWAKLHNAVAKKLRMAVRKSVNATTCFPPDPERLFQVSRKIVMAIMQNIHYKEWLPLVLGKEAMRDYGLYTGKRVIYSASVDPRIFNAFSTAAYRFGHSLIPDHYYVADNYTKLRHMFNRPGMIFDNFYGVLSSLTNATDGTTMSQRIDRHVTKEVTDHLFQPEDQDPNARSRGLDLVALNIQRGRDHGLPPLNKYRKLCGLKPIKNFAEFGNEMGENLASLYNSPDDVDLFSGGLLESAVEEGCTGPTFTCLIAMQFYALKYGDRFYFETHRKHEGFTDAQLKGIRSISLAKVLCFFMSRREFRTNAYYLKTIQRDVFHPPNEEKNRLLSCKRVRRRFLNWKLFVPDLCE